MVDDRQKQTYELRYLQLFLLGGHFPNRLINFQSVEVAQIELVIVFTQQSPILLRVCNKIAKNLVYYGAPAKFFLFHLHLL